MKKSTALRYVRVAKAKLLNNELALTRKQVSFLYAIVTDKTPWELEGSALSFLVNVCNNEFNKVNHV
jgi:hypothetical protein